jgi:hypothetical protein
MRPFLISLLAFSLLLTASGCNYVVLLGYLIGGPPSIEPDFDAVTTESLTAKDVVVAVICDAPKEVLYDFNKIDREVGKLVAYQLHKHKIKTIRPDIVRDWMDRNPNWDRPDEIAAGVNATHVIYIELSSFSVFEENSHELYRGRTEGMVTVYEIDEEGDGENIYDKELNSLWPLAAPRSTSEISQASFRTHYLNRLSDEIGRLFYEYYSGDDISHAT